MHLSLSRTCIILLLSALFVSGLYSCSGQREELRKSFAAADSIMSADPEAALDILTNLDSNMTSDLCRKDLATYTLLMSEARYKCWMPVADDTLIDYSVSYFKKRGTKPMYARALVMQGAIYTERGDYIDALECYKNAEPIIGESGDMLETGLINTRIGELYQFSFVNKSQSIARYKKALECFRAANLPDRIMFGNLTLARVMLFDSLDASLPYIQEGLALAEVLGDQTMTLIGQELMTHYYDLKHDYPNVIRTGSKAISGETAKDPALKPIVDNILTCLIKAYAETGQSEMVQQTADMMDIDAMDSQEYHYVQSALAISKGDWKSALEHERISEHLADSAMNAGMDINLREVEKRYENSRLREQNIQLRSKNLTLSLIFLGVACIAITGTFIGYSKNSKLQREVERCTDIIRSLSEGRMEKSEPAKQATDAGKAASSKETISISEEMLKVTDELLDAYYKYGRTKNIAEHVKTILENHFPENDTITRVRKIVDATYPGFLAGIEKEYPVLKEKDIYLIALMTCGFSTGTICALRRISESSLYVEKTRIAKKMGLGTRLSEYISKALESIKSS